MSQNNTTFGSAVAAIANNVQAASRRELADEAVQKHEARKQERKQKRNLLLLSRGLPDWPRVLDLVGVHDRVNADEYVAGSAPHLTTINEDSPDLKPTVALKVVAGVVARQRVAREPVILVLGGSSGTGKSIAIQYAIARHDAARYVASYEIVMRASAGYVSAPYFEQWLAARWLAIDDCGAEDDKRATVISDLLLTRWGRGLVTLISTNLEATPFADRYFGPHRSRFADRIVGENAVARWYVDCGKDSLRKRMTGGDGGAK